MRAALRLAPTGAMTAAQAWAWQPGDSAVRGGRGPSAGACSVYRLAWARVKGTAEPGAIVS